MIVPCDGCGQKVRLLQTSVQGVRAYSCRRCGHEAAITSAKTVSKYHVQPKERRTADGISFHSRTEMLRYQQLKMMEQAGEIADLQLQPVYPLILEGQLICEYRADFAYLRDGALVVEDVKGYATRTYQIKKRLMKALYGIDVQEWRS